jgi:hypothetical protein
MKPSATSRGSRPGGAAATGAADDLTGAEAGNGRTPGRDVKMPGDLVTQGRHVASVQRL